MYKSTNSLSNEASKISLPCLSTPSQAGAQSEALKALPHKNPREQWRDFETPKALQL